MKKWKVWIVILIVFFLIGGLFIYRPKTDVYDQVKATVQDLETYYSFSGNVEAKKKQSVLSPMAFQVSNILVSEGDLVVEGDTLLTTTQGIELVAGISGEVTAVYVSEDDLVTGGSTVVDLTDYSQLQIKVKVDEYNILPITVGKEVSVHVNALNQDVKGTISHVAKEAQVNNGVVYFTATIDLEENVDVYVGMSAEVKLINEMVRDAIVLPMEAIQFRSDETPYVYYQDENKEIKSREITVGISDGKYVQILNGVTQGEAIFMPRIVEMKTPFEMMKHSK